MKTLFLAFVLSAVIVNAFDNNDEEQYSCDYYAQDGSYYDFSAIGEETQGWLNGTDSQGRVWSFRICQYPDSETQAPCPSGSSVCVSQKGQVENRGSDDLVEFSDSPFSDTEGFEVVFGVTGNSDIKTVLEFVCSFDQPDVVSITFDGEYTTILVNTTNACQEFYVDGADMPMPDIEVVYTINSFLSMFILLLAGLACSLCCCCCLARRRRCQKNKDIAMKQFSNVAFQPIPSVRPTQTTVQNNIPFNPYLAQQQPQFVYYYPAQPTPVAPQHPQVELDDEKFAKELQAQYDQEARV